MATTVDANALRAARQRKGLSQSQLARTLGLPGDKSISMWEREEYEPRHAYQLHQLAEVLDVPVASLLYRDQGKSDLRYLRLVAGLDSTEVAERLHVSLATYRRWERGAWTRMPSDATIAGLAEAFRVGAGTVAAALTHTRARAQ